MIDVRIATREEHPWIIQRAGLTVTPDFAAVRARDTESGRIVAMVGYDSWTPNTVTVHVALAHPAALRHVLVPGFEIPFVHAGRKVAICAVNGTNHRSLALVKRLGFREVYRLRDGWSDGQDLVLFEMRRENCRWIRRRKAA